MKRTFITRLPNKAGAFLKATRIVAQSGANITRVSYNKAVDLHVLFLEVSGSQAQLDTIAVRLNDVGYILNEDNQLQILSGTIMRLLSHTATDRRWA